jgi:hypothetical protein
MAIGSFPAREPFMVSAGFGRRLRYLVWDKGHNKLLGIIGLGDPVFNLKARDDVINWNVKDRGRHLVNVLDARGRGSPLVATAKPLATADLTGPAGRLGFALKPMSIPPIMLFVYDSRNRLDTAKSQ